MNSVSKEDIYRVPETISFPSEEEKVLNYWREQNVFENCMKLSKGRPRYTFYDGPPFATGLPHYGHILAGTIKDIVTRYAYQQGYHVDRRFGWDCHGLPVEFEIDKSLGITGPQDVEKLGIATYNNECRKIVMRYSHNWEEIVSRMGRWIDFKNDYKTLYPWYMETIWWVFRELFQKGLVYQGVKVMPYSTACTTPLSNFESGQNYKDVVDPCVTVALESLKESNTYFLIWTTTPWTLPSNFAICMSATMDYVKVKDLKTQRNYILAESRLPYVYKAPEEYEVLEKFKGSKCLGLNYKPVFPYFEERGASVNAFRVLNDDYVTDDSGTGIVHNAPYFGEDDYRVCLRAGLITKTSQVICPVDDTGRFTEQAPDFCGQYVKDADKHIISKLKENGSLVSVGQVKHSYPYCWRSDTPLIYKAVPSWFIRVEHMVAKLSACSSQTYWVPDFVKEKRFGNWLRDARDWAVSRNRYWGTPIPIWTSPNGEEIICIGSIKELEELSGQKITDLHRENIDHIEIPSAVPGNPPLRRIAAVFDCWFESGSMPFAQAHFPFENEKDFMNSFPADFIAEGIDQTRGWFYTLLVVSTALFNKPPFKNLIANGLILASDGQKMSKRKKNYPDPLDIVHKYGADALRLYLINSPVVRAENLRFKEEGVRDVIKEVFLPWYNAYRFLLQNVARLEKEENMVYVVDTARLSKNSDKKDVLDSWILSFKESLVQYFTQEMKAYRLYTVVPRLTKFIDQLTNWYVRLNRRRIKGEFGSELCIQSLDTLFDVLFSMVIMMAPFTPFLSEYIFQRLNLLLPKKLEGSVHFQMMPVVNTNLLHSNIEVAVSRMQSVIELGRVMRDRRTIPVKYPVSEVIIVHKSQEYLSDIQRLQDYITSELNVRKLTLSSDKEKYGITLRAEPDHKALGQRLKGDFKAVMAAIKNLSDEEIQKHLAAGKFMILNHDIDLSEVRIIFCVASKAGTNFEAHSDNDVLVLMDMTPSDELMEEGLTREIVNRIQKLKKKAQLIPTDPVIVYYKVTPVDHQIGKIASKFSDVIKNTIKSNFLPFSSEEVGNKRTIALESFEFKGVQLEITICSTESVKLPAVPWANILLGSSLKPRYVQSRKATVLLQKPTGDAISLKELQEVTETIFGLYGITTSFFLNGNKLSTLADVPNGSTLIITQNVVPTAAELKETSSMPFRDFKAVMAAIKNLSDEEIQKHLAAGKFMILNHDIDLSEVRIIFCVASKAGTNFEAHSDNDVLVLMDMTPSDELMEEGLTREIVNRIQKLKKKAQLIPTDPVIVYYKVTPVDHQIGKIASKFSDVIKNTIKSNFLPFSSEEVGNKRTIALESFEFKGVQLEITICSTESVKLPAVPWANILLGSSLKPRYVQSRKATVLLQKPTGDAISLKELQEVTETIFGLYGITTSFFLNGNKLSTLADVPNGSTLIITQNVVPTAAELKETSSMPFSKYVNTEYESRNYTVILENPLEYNHSVNDILSVIYPNVNPSKITLL